MYKYLSLVLIPLSLLSCGRQNKLSHAVKLVNPLVGTDAHGHTFPGATVPFGMVQLSPDTREEGWDGCGGYHYSDDFLYGFSHTHLNGTGVPDYADILLLPYQGELKYNDRQIPGSSFTHQKEVATPGYYAATLEDYQIDAALTTTPRAGFHNYSYPAAEDARLYLDLKYRDVVTDSYLQQISDMAIAGYRHSTAWANDQRLFFYMEFSAPISDLQLFSDQLEIDEKEVRGTNIQAYFSFDLKERKNLLVKVGISAVDIEGAKNNLQQEIPHWNFAQVKKDAEMLWDQELSKIHIQGGTPEQQKVFYTALYHSYIAPNLYSDADGRYRGHDMKIHHDESHDYYTVFSLWDTFRTAHPLFTLTQQERTNDFIHTMLLQYQQGGRLPVWELAANETDCMIGYHSIPVIVDAFMKNIRNYDLDLAYEAMKHSSNTDLYGLPAYRENGYIPAEAESESVSKTLEYAYDDWCIAMIAHELGNTEDYQEYLTRAQSYKNIFDPSTGFMRARHNGRWFSPFDPKEVNFNYTEANSWQYSFFVPQDIETLISLTGGSDLFEEKLDQLFQENSATTGRQQSDITGLIGQYAHGNEPSHHMAYLYYYIGKPWKTQAIINEIMNNLYTPDPDGLCGNEDCGQMSAWYVMSALGLYPVTPGSNQYVIGYPLFDEATLNLENGHSFSIKSIGKSARNKYIKEVEINGKPWLKSYITHQQIMDGGEMTLIFSSEPSDSWGIDTENRPASSIDEFPILTVPFLISGARTFKEHTLVELGTLNPGADIYFTLDGSEPDENSSLYVAPFTIDQSVTLKAVAMKEAQKSKPLKAGFNKIDPRRSITLLTSYENQYAAGGDLALIDMIKGGKDFRTGAWQGYQGVNLEAIVDLGAVQLITGIETSFFQDINAWIFMPEKVRYFSSLDGKNFSPITEIENKIDPDLWGSHIQYFKSDQSIKTRFIKVVAINRGTCPDWHKGAGNPSWIFADEISFYK